MSFIVNRVQTNAVSSRCKLKCKLCNMRVVRAINKTTCEYLQLDFVCKLIPINIDDADSEARETFSTAPGNAHFISMQCEKKYNN